ncbi:hypothetical protein KFE19_14275 [Dysosmobacter sp. Marseille-Q4140]|nr:hypothetical protein KFE19_14275 [Dysosmobacter sp. Marseille-Q4140]
MERYRLKNIIILILALLNACLLGILALRANEEHASLRQAREQLVSLFASAGVTLDAGLISDETPPASLTLNRDEAEEQSLAAYLLGGTPVRSDQGGGIFIYTGETGAAQFRSNGGFDAVCSRTLEDPEAFFQEFCKTFGYVQTSVPQEEGTFTAVQYYLDYPVVDCTVTFTVEDGVLKRAIGTHLPNSSATPAAGEEPLSALSALTAFRNTIREGAVGTAVTDVYLCYELQSTTTALMTLVPAWCVVTDTAVYYVNCITAVVTPA